MTKDQGNPSSARLPFGLELDRRSEDRVKVRAERLRSTTAPDGLGELGTSVQFLRGVGSRASLALTSFYLLDATEKDGRNRCTVEGYPGRVLQSQMHFSAMSTIALACRKAFDHGKGLTGATFGRTSDTILLEHAKHWSGYSKAPEDETLAALRFLRKFFNHCSKKPDALFKDGSTLGKRIGFLKLHADRSAAHLSLQHYEFDRLDLAHVVAALAIVGSIIGTYDLLVPPTYFNNIDEAAANAAKALFPDAREDRLFSRMNVHMQASWCWRESEDHGIQMLTEQLPYAIGWF